MSLTIRIRPCNRIIRTEPSAANVALHRMAERTAFLFGRGMEFSTRGGKTASERLRGSDAVEILLHNGWFSKNHSLKAVSLGTPVAIYPGQLHGGRRRLNMRLRGQSAQLDRTGDLWLARSSSLLCASCFPIGKGALAMTGWKKPRRRSGLLPGRCRRRRSPCRRPS